MDGLPIGKLVLTEHDEAWSRTYEQEAGHIKCTLGERALDIQHIGSTAVPGLLAKPVIDIGLAVQSYDIVEQIVDPLSSLGYEFRGPHEEPKHYYFIKNREGLRLFHLH
ncbi:GrpB family protein, partial [Candidatus Bipolaricaulota bacterium]|nr:GrpB family protein [Candidatus Bipolaricaulota bacterium]